MTSITRFMSTTSRPVISRRRVDSALMPWIAYIGARRCKRRIGFGNRRRDARGGETTLALRLRRRSSLLASAVERSAVIAAQSGQHQAARFVHVAAGAGGRPGARTPVVVMGPRSARLPCREQGCQSPPAWCTPASTQTRRPGDRKSTRLNSSHGYISYAVFCLKKKKKTPTYTTQKSKKKEKNSTQ